MTHYCHYSSPIGALLLAEKNGALVGLWLEGEKYFPDTEGWAEICTEASPVLKSACRWLDAYFAGEQPEGFPLPMAPEGSPFQKLIWGLLMDIPYGETVTYGELSRLAAAELGKERMSAQAVGGAVGRNPISIIVPCHRVLGAKGSLTGYAGGLDRKLWLLKHEGAI